MPKYSLIIPVFNRPQEIAELIGSLEKQTFLDFEVIIVEDGSSETCESMVETSSTKYELRYFQIQNCGPGGARNFGASKSEGSWFIFLDSDTLIPEDYLLEIEDFLEKTEIDAFGGADRDREDFLPIQKAISYSMTSFLTTGGIRGSNNSLEKFKPRSFNMGIKREVFERLEGFGSMRYGEDIDFSLRIENADLNTAFIPNAYVYHKRRTTFTSFYKQIEHSGAARVLLSKLHRGSFKLVHLFPWLFTVGLIASIFLLFVVPVLGMLGIGLYVFYSMAILFQSAITSGSIQVGFLSVMASYVQLFAYSIGFSKAILDSKFK